MLSARPPSFNDHLDHVRTPGKALKHRGVLQENAVHKGDVIANVKGKVAISRTPFHNTTHAKKSAQTFHPTVVVTRPLGDKTPFPNRQIQQSFRTPAPEAAKLAKLALLDEALARTPGCLLLPSARRKSTRLPRSASKRLQTPHVQGNHWDVSDCDVELDLSQDILDEEAVGEADYDEIEYMPPRVPEQPFEPLFDMPDYTRVGRTLLNLQYIGPRDDTLDRYYSADIDTVLDVQKVLEDSGAFSPLHLVLPPLEDEDPFDQVMHAIPVRVPSRATTARSGSRTEDIKPPPLAAASQVKSIHQPTRPVTRSTARSVAHVGQGANVAAPTAVRVTRSATLASARSSRATSNANPPLRRAVSGTTAGTAHAPPAARTSGLREPRTRATATASTSKHPAPAGARVSTSVGSESRESSRAASARPSSVASTKPVDDALGFDVGFTLAPEDDFLFEV